MHGRTAALGFRVVVVVVMDSGGGVVGGCVVAGGGHGNGGNFFAVCTSFFALFSAGDICNCHSTAFSASCFCMTQRGAIALPAFPLS